MSENGSTAIATATSGPSRANRLAAIRAAWAERRPAPVSPGAAPNVLEIRSQRIEALAGPVRGTSKAGSRRDARCEHVPCRASRSPNAVQRSTPPGACSRRRRVGLERAGLRARPSPHRLFPADASAQPSVPSRNEPRLGQSNLARSRRAMARVEQPQRGLGRSRHPKRQNVVPIERPVPGRETGPPRSGRCIRNRHRPVIAYG